MKRVLGWIFNRWVLGAVLLAALILVIWIVGPIIAVGDLRPLDSERARWITTAILLVVVALWVAWRLWRARRGNAVVVDRLIAQPPGGPKGPQESADMAAVRQRFTEAMATLRKARFGPAGAGAKPGKLSNRLGGRYLYELPWYMIIGAPGSGKTTALRNSGLQFPLADKVGDQAVRGVGGTRNCDWWFTDQAVLIDTAGRFTTQDSDQATDSATWTGFLSLLKRSRPRQPLNGVLVTVSLSDLITKSAAERAKHAATVRQRMQELHEKLNVRFPIYLLVTKCDLMAGFMDTFEALDKQQRATPWGFTFALDKTGLPKQPPLNEIGPEFDLLQQRLSDGLVDRLQMEADPQRRARIYGFPAQFAALRGALLEFVEAVFSPSPYEAQPLLRGVYFVSGTQEGTPIDRMLGSIARQYQLERAVLPPLQASGRSYFLARLLTEVVFAEQGLAGTNLGWERKRQMLVVAAYAGIAVLAVGTIAAWLVSYGNNKRYVETVAQRVDAVRRLVQETPNRASAELVPVAGALQATRGLALAGEVKSDADVPWSLGFGLYQGRRLDSAARAAYERMLVDAMLPRLAIRVEEQLRAGAQQDSRYEALKAYLMMYEPQHFDAAALKAHVEDDWDANLVREITTEQREQLSGHIDALLAQGAAVSPLPQDNALIEATRVQLAQVALPQRVYNRLRQRGLGAEFPEFSIARAGGGNAPLVFTRASGAPLTKGVPGLFSFDGYHKGFQNVVGDVTKQLADEQDWVLGIKSGDTKGVQALLASGRLNDDVRRIYLNEYAATWEAFIADIRLVPSTSIAQSLQTTRLLAAPDTPLVPLLKAMARETTLLAGGAGAEAVKEGVRGAVQASRDRLLGSIGVRAPTSGAPAARIESLVDDRFVGLRRLVTAPEGGKPPIDGVIARLGELQVLLTAVDSALKGGAAPPASPLPNQLKAEAANAPEPVRSMLDNLGSSSSRVALMQLRETLARDVRSQIGEFCQQAIAGRYPFDPGSPRDVTQADFAAVFGPGGKFDLMVQQKLAAYVDTSTRPWSFRAVDGTPLGTDAGSLPQFQRAAAIRETFFPPGSAGLALRLEFKPVEMDPALQQFVLDVDGQIVRYAHGPQIPAVVQWPGPRGAGQVRVMVSPSGSGGMVADGPWALFRLFERVNIQPGAAPEKFRAVFDIDGRRAIFDVTTSSVRNPFRMAELRQFSCPQGL